MSTIEMDERRRLVAAGPFGAAFPGHDLDDVVRLLIERRFTDRAMIFARGEPGSSLLIVARGRVRIGVVGADGREVLLTIVERGGVFGEVSLLDRGPRSADAVACGACVLLELQRAQLLPLLRRSPDAAIRLLTLLCERVRRATDRVEGLALLPVTARLARLLLDLAERDGRAGPEGLRVPVPLSQGDIGRLIGASRQKVNQHLGRLHAEGLVERRGAGFVIRDHAGLAALAEAA